MDDRVSQIINDAVALDAKTHAEAAALHNEGGSIAGFWIRLVADTPRDLRSRDHRPFRFACHARGDQVTSAP